MASTKVKIAIAVVMVLFLAGLGYLILKVKTHIVQARALAELKADNPVEYYVLHTPLKLNEDELRNAMVGKWRLAGAHSRRTGEFVYLEPLGNSYFKTFTESNWAIATYDISSNLLYSAGGLYTLQGENYTEHIDEATGMMTQYLHATPHFKIRVVGDKYYQMNGGKNPTIEEMWQRVDE